MGVDFFLAGTDGSPNQADYNVQGTTFGLGGMARVDERVELGGYFAMNKGNLDGELIDADASGWVLGLSGSALVHPQSGATIGAGLSYGSFDFQGTRGGVITGPGGAWAPTDLDFDDISGNSLLAYLDVSWVVWKNEQITISPTLALYSVWSDRESIRETAAAPGATPALRVGSEDHNASFIDLQLAAEYDPEGPLSAIFLVGGTIALDTPDRRFDANFTTGQQPFSVTAPGLDSDAWFLGTGVSWAPEERVRLGLNLRADFPSDADPAQSISGYVRFQF